MEFNSIQDFRTNFTHVYHSTVVKLLEPYERERLMLKKRCFKIRSACYIAVGVIGCFICFLVQAAVRDVLVAVIFSVLCSLFVILPKCLGISKWFVSHIKKSYEEGLKFDIMPKVMKAFGAFAWLDGGLIDRHIINETKLFYTIDEKSNDEGFYGAYRDLPITIDETMLRNYSADGIMFKGVLVRIELDKTYKGHTIIRKRESINKAVYEEVKLEDPEFSEKYFVDADDQIEARYLLTTSFMERYKNIKNAFHATKIEASISGNNMIFAISTDKDLFKLGRFDRPVNDKKQFTELLNEFVSILAIVDELKLNQNIGL